MIETDATIRGAFGYTSVKGGTLSTKSSQFDEWSNCRLNLDSLATLEDLGDMELLAQEPSLVHMRRPPAVFMICLSFYCPPTTIETTIDNADMPSRMSVEPHEWSVRKRSFYTPTGPASIIKVKSCHF